MVKPTHFSKALAFILAFSMPVAAVAEDSLSDIARSGLQMMKKALGNDEAEVLYDQKTEIQSQVEFFPELQEITAGVGDAVLEGTEAGADEVAGIETAPDWLKKQLLEAEQKANRPVMYLFATRAMPELELVELLREASPREGVDLEVQVVLRGIYPEEKIPDAIAELSRIADKAYLTQKPKVIINPELFKTFDVTDAPQIVYARDEQVLIRARGTFAIDWILNEYERNGREGDIGSYGAVTSVNEIDLIELMKTRLAKLDLQKKKQEMVDNYWKQKTFAYIPDAKRTVKVKLEPTVIATQDFQMPDGQLLVKAGERYNPLHQMPFTTKLLIFNPMDEEHVKWVEKKVTDLEAADAYIQLIATRLDTERGWEHLSELDKRLGHPVYLLTPEIQQRFNIARIPAFVEADDRYFFVEYIGVREQPQAPVTMQAKLEQRSAPAPRKLNEAELAEIEKERQRQELRALFRED